MMTEEFTKKEIWTKHGDYFLVEVVHWTSPDYDYITYEKIGIKNHWNVYLKLFKKHPLFGKLDFSHDVYYNQPLIGGLDFHSGITFMEWLYDVEGNPIRCTLGSDYGHIYDNMEDIATEKDAWNVFRDADSLYNQVLTWSENNED